MIPAGLRERQGWGQSTVLVLIETDDGVLVTTRDQLRRLVARQLAGPSLVEELLADRRREAARQ